MLEWLFFSKYIFYLNLAAYASQIYDDDNYKTRVYIIILFLDYYYYFTNINHLICIFNLQLFK